MVKLHVAGEAVGAEQAEGVVELVLALLTSLASSAFAATRVAILSPNVVSQPTRTRKLLL